MTQTFQGPDGQQYGFPDEMSMDDIKGVFAKKFPVPSAQQAPGATPGGTVPLAGSSGGALPTNVVPGSGTATGVTGDMPFDSSSGPTLQGTTDTLRLFNKGLTAGLWDPAVGAVKSLFGGGISQRISEEQQKTRAAEQQQGVVPETIGAMISPANKMFTAENAVADITNPFLRWLARPLAYGAEGSAYSGVRAAGSGENVPEAMAKGGALSAAASPLGALAETSTTPSPTTAAFKDKMNDSMNDLGKIRYSDQDVGRASYGAQTDLTKQQYNPALDANKVGRFTDAFTKWAQDPSQEHSALQLLNWRNTADERGADSLVAQIDQHLRNAIPVKGPKEVNSAEDVLGKIKTASDAIQNHAISSALDQQTTNIGGVQIPRSPTYSEVKGLTGAGTAAGNSGQALSDHAWRVAHAFTEPVAVATGLAHGAAGVIPAVGVTLGTAPPLKYGANKMMTSQVPGIINRWRSETAGAPFPITTADPTWPRMLQSLMLGSQPSTQ